MNKDVDGRRRMPQYGLRLLLAIVLLCALLSGLYIETREPMARASGEFRGALVLVVLLVLCGLILWKLFPRRR